MLFGLGWGWVEVQGFRILSWLMRQELVFRCTVSGFYKCLRSGVEGFGLKVYISSSALSDGFSREGIRLEE